MSKFNKFLILISFLIILLIAGIIFVSFLIKDKTSNNKNLNTNKVENEINFFENNYGIAHIVADSDEDLFFAIGYYHAEKRLWQIEFNRRLALGKLSEVLGDKSLVFDKFLRSFEIENIAKNNWEKLSGKSQSILKSYSDGINFFLKKNKNNLPFEFDLLEYVPQKWEPWQSLAVGRLMSFEFSLGIWIDIVNGQIADQMGNKYLDYFIPNYNDFNFNNQEITFSNPELIRNLAQFINQYSFFRGSIGSNCWVTGGTESQKENLILANDPHTPITVPARWLQAHITNENINTVGLMLPGIPLPLIGRNDNISWGITSILIDDFDYYIEKISNDGKKYFRNDSSAKNIIFEADSILIKNQNPHLYYKMKTDKSILISDFHLSNDLSVMTNSNIKYKNKYFKKYALSFDWTGKEISDEILALYKINRSSNFYDFQSGLNTWATPGLYFHYIGNDKLIKIVPCGSVPIRPTGLNPLLPQDISKNDLSWKSTYKLQSKYIISDSLKQGYLSSANNLLINQHNYITNYSEPISRFERMNEVLNLEKPNNIDRTQYLQSDFNSIYAKKMILIINKIINDKIFLLDNLGKKAFNKLQNWKYIFSINDIGSSIYTMFYFNLINNTFKDELGAELLSQYTFISSVSTRKIYELLTDNIESKVFDNILTNEIENREYIIFKSFKDAVQQCKEYFKNENINTWNYGKLHTIEPNHIFNRDKALKQVFTFGEYPIGGNNTTILNSDWNFSDKFKTVVYPSARFVTDLTDSLVYFSIPGGASGNPQSSNYKDQFQLWLSGGYISIPISRTPNQDFKKKITINKE